MNGAGEARPRVVALMPAWNAEAFIGPVLESLAAQSYPDFSVLISDDASTDATPAICAEFAARHRNFRLIRQTRNLGWIGNVNALLAAAEGEFLFFAFHDDLPKPRYVERLVEALAAAPDASLAFSDMIRREAGRVPTADDVKVYRDLDGVASRPARGVIVARKWGVPPSYTVTLANRGLFRATAARQVGGLRRHVAGEFGADWPWLLGLALRGRFVRVAEPLIEKTYRPTSVSAKWRYSLWQRLGVLLSCLQEIRRAGLPLGEQWLIARALTGAALKRQWWRICAAAEGGRKA